MKFLKNVKIILFLSILIGFSSCENYYTDDFFRNSDEKLCNRLWERTYLINDKLCTHQLIFREAPLISSETFEYREKKNSNWNDIAYLIQSYSFYWEWSDKELEGIIIKHPLDGILFFDNVWIRTHYLSGNLSGEEVTFFGQNVR
ncbi:hypothetical protein EZS27_007855 [termite gut metagenome]|jgi:hypothetical protein|uniref:Lipoprotein n=1 Tax=termite gut metagenome TaxID=433724 RepID=A0A5J4SH29_9ZZZZ